VCPGAWATRTHCASHRRNGRISFSLGPDVEFGSACAEVLEFDGAIAIVIERFDRVTQGKEILRLHAEDCCQALGVPPERKYENEGGPGAMPISDLLRNTSTATIEDVAAFAHALIFNWLIAGTDAHAKNYSLLIGVQGHVRLAPLYDIASVLAYLMQRLQDMTAALPDAIADRSRAVERQKLRHPNLARLRDGLYKRATGS